MAAAVTTLHLFLSVRFSNFHIVLQALRCQPAISGGWEARVVFLLIPEASSVFLNKLFFPTIHAEWPKLEILADKPWSLARCWGGGADFGIDVGTDVSAFFQPVQTMFLLRSRCRKTEHSLHCLSLANLVPAVLPWCSDSVPVGWYFGFTLGTLVKLASYGYSESTVSPVHCFMVQHYTGFCISFCAEDCLKSLSSAIAEVIWNGFTAAVKRRTAEPS